jgi:hypothetical protein
MSDSQSHSQYRAFEAEWDALQSEPDLDQRRVRKEAAIASKAAMCSEDEHNLLKDLRGMGFDGGSVWDLVDITAPFPQFVPALISNLSPDLLPPTREAIYRALIGNARGNEQVFAVLFQFWRDGIEEGTNKRCEYQRQSLAFSLADVAATADHFRLLSAIVDPADPASFPLTKAIGDAKKAKLI